MPNVDGDSVKFVEELSQFNEFGFWGINQYQGFWMNLFNLIFQRTILIEIDDFQLCIDAKRIETG